MRSRLLVAVMAAGVTFGGARAAVVADFDDLSLGAESFWNGADESGGFQSGNAYFVNNYNPDFACWDGWAYSNTSDTVTGEYTNQYSAYTGGGHSGSNYAIAYDPLNIGGFGAHPKMELTGSAYGSTLAGAFFTNTTYAAVSMRDGNAFAKRFGGVSGNDEDWFKLTITGIDTAGQSVGSVDFYLADYRFEDNNRDYIVDEWQFVDMTGLGEITGLEFSVSSSDAGQFGMNTPAYFAMDTVVPEPGTIALLALGGLMLVGRKQ